MVQAGSDVVFYVLENQFLKELYRYGGETHIAVVVDTAATERLSWGRISTVLFCDLSVVSSVCSDAAFFRLVAVNVVYLNV